MWNPPIDEHSGGWDDDDSEEEGVHYYTDVPWLPVLKFEFHYASKGRS